MDPDPISGSRYASTLQLFKLHKLCQHLQGLCVQYTMWHMYSTCTVYATNDPLVTGEFVRIFTEIYSFAIEKIRYGSVNNYFRTLNY
jgi:hypothetical protein